MAAPRYRDSREIACLPTIPASLHLLGLLGGLRLGLGRVALRLRHHHEAFARTVVLALAVVLRGVAVAVTLAGVHALAFDLGCATGFLGMGGPSEARYEHCRGCRRDERTSSLHESHLLWIAGPGSEPSGLNCRPAPKTGCDECYIYDARLVRLSLI